MSLISAHNFANSAWILCRFQHRKACRDSVRNLRAFRTEIRRGNGTLWVCPHGTDLLWIIFAANPLCSEIRTKSEIRNAQQYLRISSPSPLKSIHKVRNIYLLFPQQNWTYCGFQNPHRGSFSVRRISAALLYSAGTPTRVNLPQGGASRLQAALHYARFAFSIQGPVWSPFLSANFAPECNVVVPLFCR